MKKIHALALLALCTTGMNAQEKAMRVQMTDDSYTLTRVSELSKISFLSIADHYKGVIVDTKEGEPVTVLFDARPVLTMKNGSLVMTSDAADSQLTIAIDDISEIRFGTATPTSIDGTAAATTSGVTCVFGQGAALFRGIPEGIRPTVCTADGRNVPVDVCSGGEMRLSRETVGTGIFIVRIGSFTTKITL